MLNYLKSKKTGRLGNEFNQNYQDSVYQSNTLAFQTRQNFYNRSIRVTRNWSKVIESPQRTENINERKRSRSTIMNTIRSKTSHLKTRSIQVNTCVRNKFIPAFFKIEV